MLACSPWEGNTFAFHICTGPEIGLWHFGLKGTTITEIPTTSLWLTEMIALRSWWKRQQHFSIWVSLEGWMAIRKHKGITVDGFGNLPPIPV